MRLLTADQARRSILGRQGLIQPFDDPHEAVRAMVAVQTQYAASLPVSVAARIKKGKPGWDDRALEVGGSLIKSWSVRNTLHAHLPEDHALILDVRGERAYQRYLGWMRKGRAMEMAEIEPRIEEVLREGPLSRDELHDRVPELREIESVGWGLDVMGLAFRQRLCIIGRGATQCFALLPESEVARMHTAADLLRRYLGAYGPATLADFTHWSGLPADLSRRALQEAEEVERLEVEGMSGPRLVLPDTVDEISSETLGVRLLAKFDPLILSYRDKTLFLDEKHRTRVFRIAGQVEAIILSEGRVCATWRLERKAKSAIFRIEPFRPLKPRELSRLNKEAASMAKKLGLGTAQVEFS